MAKKVKKTAKKSTAKKTVKKKKAAQKTTAKKPAKKSVTKKKTAVKSTRKSDSKRTAKKSAAQPAEKRRTRKRPKSILTPKELQHFRELLVEKLKEIIGDVDHIESEALKRSRMDATGDLSSMPIHMADIGSDNYEQEFALGLMHSERKLVLEIFAALKRIDSGSYGICEGTGEPIPKPRLEGIPWARYCVEYAEKLEKGLVNEEDSWYNLDEEEDADAEFENEAGFVGVEDYDEEDEDEDPDAFFYSYDEEDDEDDEDFV